MEAVLFFAKGMNFRQQVLEYRVFGRAAEAIRFVIEDLPSNVLRGCSLEVGEDRYSGDDSGGDATAHDHELTFKSVIFLTKQGSPKLQSSFANRNRRCDNALTFSGGDA